MEPGIERGEVEREDDVIGGVGGGEGEEGEGIEGRREEGDIGAFSLLVGFGDGEPNVGEVEEDVLPTEEEDFFWVDKGVE